MCPKQGASTKGMVLKNRCIKSKTTLNEGRTKGPKRSFVFPFCFSSTARTLMCSRLMVLEPLIRIILSRWKQQKTYASKGLRQKTSDSTTYSRSICAAPVATVLQHVHVISCMAVRSIFVHTFICSSPTWEENVTNKNCLRKS